MKKIVFLLFVVPVVLFGQSEVDYTVYEFGCFEMAVPNSMALRASDEENVMKQVREYNGIKELRKNLGVDGNRPTSTYRFNLKGWYDKAIKGSQRHLDTRILIKIAREKATFPKMLNIENEKVAKEREKVWSMIKKSMQSAMGNSFNLKGDYSKFVNIDGVTGLFGYMDYSIEDASDVASYNYVFLTGNESISITMNCLLSDKSKWEKAFKKAIHSIKFYESDRDKINGAWGLKFGMNKNTVRNILSNRYGVMAVKEWADSFSLTNKRIGGLDFEDIWIYFFQDKLYQIYFENSYTLKKKEDKAWFDFSDDKIEDRFTDKSKMLHQRLINSIENRYGTGKVILESNKSRKWGSVLFGKEWKYDERAIEVAYFQEFENKQHYKVFLLYVDHELLRERNELNKDEF